MTTAKMSWFSILIYHFILIDVTLALALAGNKPETEESQAAATKTANATSTLMTSTTTTELPSTASEDVSKQEGAEIHSKENESMEKSIPKKRGILENTYRSLPGVLGEEGFDGNEESAPEELFSSSRSVMEEKPYFTNNDRGNSAFMFDDGYFENEGRSKRTAEYDGFYNRPQEPEVELTPDEFIALLNSLEERRLYNTQKQTAWPDYDNTVDSIEADMRDADVYRERPINRFGNGYDSNYDRYPTGMKRYMITRRRRSNFLGNPKLKVPIFRRAFL